MSTTTKKKGRVSFITKYDSGGSQAVLTTFRLGADDLQLRASCSDQSFVRGSQFKGITLGVEKPGAFVLEYDMFETVPRFQYTGFGKLFGKDTGVAYTHQPKSKDPLMVDGFLYATPESKLHGRIIFPQNKGHVKLSYMHKGLTTVEPAVEFPSKAWNLGVSHKFSGNHLVKATYDHLVKTVGVAWSREPENGGACRIAANLPLEDPKNVRVIMEKTWNLEF